MGDIIRHRPFTLKDSAGNAYRVTLRQVAPTLRYEVIVNGECVGWGFATREDAEARAYEAIREDRWSFSRGARSEQVATLIESTSESAWLKAGQLLSGKKEDAR